MYIAIILYLLLMCIGTYRFRNGIDIVAGIMIKSLRQADLPAHVKAFYYLRIYTMLAVFVLSVPLTWAWQAIKLMRA